MLRCATSNSSPCCCRRACSYRLVVLLALEWDTNPTRDIELRPQEGPYSPCSRSAAALSFWCVCRADKHGWVRPMRCTKDAAKGYSLNCQSGAGQFFHHTERDARTRPSRMADERRGVLSTARVRKTRANTLSRAVRPTSYPQVCISWGEDARGSAGLVLFLATFCHSR